MARPMRTLTQRTLFTALLAATSALCGCPNPNTYGTPRTVAPGKVSHSVAVEGFGVTGTTTSTTTTTDPDTGETRTTTEKKDVGLFLPNLPSYQLRVGVAEKFDIGLHLYNLTSLGADFKWNPIRGIFDLAVDPGFQYFYASNADESVHVLYMHAPLMLAVNPTDWLSVVLTPGVVYGLASADISGEDSVSNATGLLIRAGLGVQFRITDRFAIHPEFTMMKSLEDSNATLYNFGIGFNFGALPSYADLRGEGEETDRPPPHGPQGAPPGPQGSPPAPPPEAPPPGYAPAPGQPSR